MALTIHEVQDGALKTTTFTGMELVKSDTGPCYAAEGIESTVTMYKVGRKYVVTQRYGGCSESVLNGGPMSKAEAEAAYKDFVRLERTGSMFSTSYSGVCICE